MLWSYKSCMYTESMNVQWLQVGCRLKYHKLHTHRSNTYIHICVGRNYWWQTWDHSPLPGVPLSVAAAPFLAYQTAPSSSATRPWWWKALGPGWSISLAHSSVSIAASLSVAGLPSSLSSFHQPHAVPVCMQQDQIYRVKLSVSRFVKQSRQSYYDYYSNSSFSTKLC